MTEEDKIFSVRNKTVLITGSTGYFGKYITEGFLDRGAKVILLGRSKDKLSLQQKELQKKYNHKDIVTYNIDFYEKEQFKNLLEKIVNAYNIDILINNAYDLSKNTGFNTKKGTLENSDFYQWHKAFESGIYWAVLSTQIIGNQFIKKNKGSIINVSSMYGIVSPDPSLYKGKDFFNPPTYGVNKAGIDALTRYTASFWGGFGIRCNSIAPGPFPNVESSSDNSVNSEDPFIERLIDKTVLKRVGHPNDLIGAFIFLASDASLYITGQTIQVDGGWTIT